MPTADKTLLPLGVGFVAVGIIIGYVYIAYPDTVGSILDYGNNNASQAGALLLVALPIILIFIGALVIHSGLRPRTSKLPSHIIFDARHRWTY